MSVIILNGVPGSGKTLNLTREAVYTFKAQNRLITRIERKIKGLPIYVNTIYSNYPILLNKRKQIYSHKASIFDLTIDNKFPEGSSMFFMEIQLSYDSMEYNKFPDIIAAFLQAHRHGDIYNIYFDSQSMSRIPKKMRIIACERWQILWTFHFERFIPFLHLGITCYKVCYDTEEEKTTDLPNEKRLKFFNTKKVSKAYDTKCLKALWSHATPYDKGCYTSLIMSYEDICDIYFRTSEFKDQLYRRNVLTDDLKPEDNKKRKK